MNKKSKPILLILLLTLGLTVCCSKETSRITQRAFYYWETSFSLNNEDTSYLNKLAVNKLYIHFFDVTYTNYLSPEGRIYFQSKIPKSLEVVPVVFITNETISKLDSIDIIDLAKKIETRLKKEISRTQIESQVTEIQLDCDWTKSTRNKYFYLLKLIKKQMPYTLSATVRLHQYKYQASNIPPVDKGMLMCYNINNPTQFDVSNSLFDKAEVMQYIKDIKYPMAIDLAVPTFSWGVRFNAQKEFIGLCNAMRLADIKNDTNFITTARTNVFEVKHDCGTSGQYFTAGELVRIEECNITEVAEIVSYLKTEVNQAHATLTLFHFDRILKQHENQKDIINLFNAAR